MLQEDCSIQADEQARLANRLFVLHVLPHGSSRDHLFSYNHFFIAALPTLEALASCAVDLPAFAKVSVKGFHLCRIA